MEKDEYLTIASRSEGFYSDLRSKFLAFAFPVNSEDDVRKNLTELKREYHDARHIAYAYIIGAGEEAFRANDDGEPSGTAGKPILGQLRSKSITNAMVAVIRYFGGVKLGTSRLTEAYRAAAADSLEKAELKTELVECMLSIKFDYSQMNSIMKILRDVGGTVTHSGFSMESTPKATMTVKLRKGEVANFKERIYRIAETTE